VAVLESSLTQKGQVTIPAVIRSRLGLKPRDRVAFVVEGDEVRLRAVGSRILAGYGAVPPIQRPEDFGAVRERFEQAVAADVAAETE
jgi:antitoxin PrlF